MSDRPLPGARRFETFVRWSTYSAVALPVATFLGSALVARGPVGTDVPVQVGVFGLVLALTAGNVLVSRWSIDALVGRASRLPVGLLAGWALVLVALVVVAPMVPLPAMQLTAVTAVASVAASFVPALGAVRTAVLNTVVLVATGVLAGTSDLPVLVAGLIVITAVLWACWSNAWLLRVLLDLQKAHADRAALTVAQERLRISRDLHDVLGRTLATIAVKSSLAAELVDRGGTERAAREISGIRRIAEGAGHEMRRVVRGEHRTTWDDEVTGARSLLESAGIRCGVSGDPVPAGSAEVLAWVVREAVTNVLRHSAATQVTLATTHRDEDVLLTITNDGVTNDGVTNDGVTNDGVTNDGVTNDRATTDRTTGGLCAAGSGTGLDSLSKRITALGGHVTTRRDGSRFVLDAVVPARQEEPG